MSVGQSLFTQLSHACYHLDLLKGDIDEIKEKTPEPPQHPSPADVLNVAITSLHSFQESIRIETPLNNRKIQVLFPSIIEKANRILMQMEKRTSMLSTSKKTAHDEAEKELLERLKTAIHDCKETLTTTEEKLLHSDPIPSQKPDLRQEIISYAGHTAGQKLVDFGTRYFESEPIQFKLQQIQASILKNSTNLTNASGSDIPTKFVDTLSAFIMSYLKEHILHVNEREPALRPQFLRFFFDNLYADNLRKIDPESPPTPTTLGSVFIPLLQNPTISNLMTDCIRLNLFKALSQGLGTVYSLKDTTPFFVTSLFDTIFKTTLDDVRQEISSKSAGDRGINLLTADERAQILSTRFQENFVKTILSFAFPNGPSDLEIPDILSEIPGKQVFENYLKEKVAWEGLKKILEELTKTFFVDLSKNDDVKQQLLIKAYEEANSLLSGMDTSKKEPHTLPKRSSAGVKMNLSTVSLISIGIITTIFHIIVESIKNVIHHRRDPTTFTYKKQGEINSNIEKTMEWLVKGSKIRSFFVKLFGKKVAEAIGNTTVRSLQEIDVKKFINIQLASITEIISPENYQRYMARTAQEELQNEEKLKKERTDNAAHLRNLKTAFGNNFNGIIKNVAEEFYPTEIYKDEANRLHKKIHYFCRCFLQKGIRNFISFFLWTIDARRITKELEQKSSQIVETIDQDALLMTISQKALKKLKKLSSSPSV